MKKQLNIPLLDLKREYTFLKKEINRQIKECLSSQHWILGEKTTQFEEKLSAYLGSKYAIGLNSGTDALLIALRAQAVKLKKKEFFDRRDEIITTPFTFVATAESIVRSGATPVFVDIDPQTFNIDPEQIKKAVNKNTAGIIPVHLFGCGCRMDKISAIAKEKGLFIVEDVAQAFGAEDGAAKKLGTIGECGAFSFFPSKNLGSYGDAGAVVTNDEKIADIITLLRNHGQRNQYDAEYIGYNSRLDSIQAAILLAKLKYIDKFNAARRNLAEKYDKGLEGVEFIQTHFTLKNHVYNLYTIKVPKKMRDRLLTFLNNKGIQARIYYPKPLHKMQAFKEAKQSGSLKNTEEAALTVISLPIDPFLSSREISYILEAVRRFR